MNSWSTALTTIRRTPYQALNAIVMMTVTFAVAHVFALLMLGANITLQYFEAKPQIIAFFELGTSADDIESVSQKFKDRDYINDVIIVTQEDALAIYQENNKEEPLLLELVTADILPASIEISANSIKELPGLKEDLEAIDSIDDVSYQEDIVDILQTWTTSLRLLGLGIVGLLGVNSFLIITTVVTLKAANQKRSIGIMRLLGASKGFISKPFMIEGITYGFLGAVFGWCISLGVLLYMTPWLTEFMEGILSFPLPVEFLAIQCGIGVAAGMVFGAVASLVGSNRQIRK